METIKFRGLRTDGKRWVYGFYVYRPDGKHLIYWQPFSEATQNTYHEVIPETVGQFVGLTDKNGKEIYSGDITDQKLVVKWNILHNGWCLFSGGSMKSEMLSDVYDNHGNPVKPYYDCEIIGNIFENKDLINQ